MARQVSQAARHAYLAVALFAAASAAAPPESIRVPAGFVVERFAAGIDGARSLALGARGTVFVGTRRTGKVYAVVDRDGDGRADQVYTLARGLDMPNGVAFFDGDLYVAENHRIVRFDDIERRLERPPEPVIVRDDLPRERHHGWRYLRVGPDRKLYVAIGAPCNVCERAGFAEIRRMNLDGSAMETVARGVRNSVGFDWHPQTGKLWFTDNGRDWLGDDRPPDELNRLERIGRHFGFPYCHGRALRDPQFGARRDCTRYQPPVQELGPHVAALGMRFYTGTAFPAEYRNQIFIAEHGSWNRSRKIGYRVSLVRLQGDRAVGYEPFAEGWLVGERVRGRPVDLAVTPDGALLVSDDASGTIERIRYVGDPEPDRADPSE